MSSKEKKKVVKFTLQSLIRLLIFLAVIYFLINILSIPKTVDEEIYDPTVLGVETTSALSQSQLSDYMDSLYQQIPEDSRKSLENFNQNPVFLSIQEKFEQLKTQTNGFPDKQIKEIKKAIVKSIYDDMIRSIDGE